MQRDKLHGVFSQFLCLRAGTTRRSLHFGISASSRFAAIASSASPLEEPKLLLARSHDGASTTFARAALISTDTESCSTDLVSAANHCGNQVLASLSLTSSTPKCIVCDV